MSAKHADDVGTWSAALESALLREIAQEHRRLSAAHFRERLRLPQFVLAEAEGYLGRWISGERTLELSRKMLLTKPWATSLEVLKHEMLHQFLDEVLEIHDETAHGSTFRDLGEKLGIDTRAAGMPNATPTENHILDRITKLLALAESPNQHEAEAAMAAAQRLLLKYNLDVTASQTRPGYGFRQVGKPKTRTFEPDRQLATLITTHFFVEGIWISVYMPFEKRRGSVLEIAGTNENLDIAEYVHGFLANTAERLFQDHVGTGGIRKGDRRTFLAGVLSGVSDRLHSERKKQKQQGLVWVKDADLFSYYRKRHPHIRHVRYASGRETDAYERGRAEGRRVIIHRGMKDSPSPGGIRGLLNR